MGFRYQTRQFVDGFFVDQIFFRKPVESRVLIEAAHKDGPFDDFSGTVDMQFGAFSRNRNHPDIYLRRVLPVDREFRLAGRFPFFQRGEIHIGIRMARFTL